MIFKILNEAIHNWRISIPKEPPSAISESIKEFLRGSEGKGLFKEFLNGQTGSDYECIDMSRTISDKVAEKEIKSYLRGLKNEGIMEVNLLDIIVALNLPSEQIERVMEKLRRRS